MTHLLQAYCTAAKLDKAINIFLEMEGEGMAEAHVCSILLLNFLERGLVDQVIELLERMREVISS